MILSSKPTTQKKKDNIERSTSIPHLDLGVGDNGLRDVVSDRAVQRQTSHRRQQQAWLHVHQVQQIVKEFLGSAERTPQVIVAVSFEYTIERRQR